MKYKHVSQKPYSCVPACVQMVLQRRKLPLRSQTKIAYDLGVVLPPADRHLLPKSYKGSKPGAGWGTRLNLKKYSLAVFLKQQKYPLQATRHSVEEFKSIRQFKKFLLDNMDKDNDLLICFNYPRLYRLAGDWGHASLIEEVNQKQIVLRDPSSKYKTARKVLLADLLAALKKHYQGGIWVINKLLTGKH